MWNGLWKLTAMVVVIGVGLFAAYQAQQGMNRTAVKSSADGGEDAANSESDGVSGVRRSAVASASDDPFPEGNDQDFEESLSQKHSPKPPVLKDAIPEFNDDINDTKDVVKQKLASVRAKAEKATKRSSRIDFTEEPESPDEDQPVRKAATVTASHRDSDSSDFSEGTRARSPIRQIKAASTDDELLDDRKPDPFAEDAPSKSIGDEGSNPDRPDDSVAPPDSRTDVEAPSEDVATPPRSQSSVDPMDDPELPRSNAARRRRLTAVEPLAEFEDSQPAPRQTAEGRRPQQDPPSLDPDNSPALDTPAVQSGRSRPDRTSDRDLLNDAAPRSLPTDSPAILGDDTPPPRSQPNRSRPAMPVELPADTGVELLNSPPPRSRELNSRRNDDDRVTPVDMVGDGLVGDLSQRGLQQPRLTIEKVAQQQAVIEQPLVYTIIVKNTGSVDAHNIVIEDRIPKGTELMGTAPQAELSGKRLIWNQLVLKPNEEKKISIKVLPKQEGPIGSVARVYFGTEVSTEIVVAAPQLEFTVKAPSEIRIGQRFDLVYNLRNVGKVDANNIKVQDLVPDQLKHEAGTDIECPIGKMAPQEIREIVLPVIAIKTGTAQNRAIMTADSGVKKTLDSTIDVVGEVLVLTRTGQERLYVERTAVFTNNIRNDGNQRADRVKISEVVPAGMEFDSASDGGRYDPNLRAVVWTVGPLSPGDDKSVNVKYVPKETGTLPAKITAIGSAGSTATVNATVDVIGKPELQMETLSATGVVTVGDRITSKFQLNNTGTASANNVQLKIKLPKELQLISVKGAKYQKRDEYILFEPIVELAPRTKACYELVLEPTEEADAQIRLEIAADHLSKPGVRVEAIAIARDALK